MDRMTVVALPGGSRRSPSSWCPARRSAEPTGEFLGLVRSDDLLPCPRHAARSRCPHRWDRRRDMRASRPVAARSGRIDLCRNGIVAGLVPRCMAEFTGELGDDHEVVRARHPRRLAVVPNWHPVASVPAYVGEARIAAVLPRTRRDPVLAGADGLLRPTPSRSPAWPTQCQPPKMFRFSTPKTAGSTWASRGNMRDCPNGARGGGRSSAGTGAGSCLNIQSD